MKTATPVEFMGTAYFIRAAAIGRRMAELLGQKQEAELFARAERTSRVAFERAFAKGNGVYGPGGQTAQALVLTFGLVPAEQLLAARARLVEAFREADDHIDVGVQGMSLVFRALSDMGRTDLAYRVLTRESSPSPLDWVKAGETTLGDHVRGNANSRNHVMYGDYVAWAFKYLAGIAPAAPGYARALVAPRPVPALGFVTASTLTPRGEVRSAWRIVDGTFMLEVSLPADMPTEVRLPDGTVHDVAGGTHAFRCECRP